MASMSENALADLAIELRERFQTNQSPASMVESVIDGREAVRREISECPTSEDFKETPLFARLARYGALTLDGVFAETRYDELRERGADARVIAALMGIDQRRSSSCDEVAANIVEAFENAVATGRIPDPRTGQTSERMSWEALQVLPSASAAAALRRALRRVGWLPPACQIGVAEQIQARRPEPGARAIRELVERSLCEKVALPYAPSLTERQCLELTDVEIRSLAAARARILGTATGRASGDAGAVNDIKKEFKRMLGLLPLTRRTAIQMAFTEARLKHTAIPMHGTRALRLAL